MSHLKTFIIGFFLVNTLLLYSQNNIYSPRITIDLAAKAQKKESVAGFLHFNDLEPLEKNIKQLKPRFWRFGAKLKEHTPKRKQQVDILLKNNITPIIVLSDIYDEEHWYKEKGGWIRPSDDSKPFTALVKKLFTELGNKTVFDVWNEPDLKEVWGGTREEYFKTFKVAHDALRSSKNGEQALITGPSISSYNKEYIDAFLNYCNENKIKLDILNWHSLGDQKDAIKLGENIAEAKKLLVKYPNLDVKNIYIPEIIGLKEQFDPLSAFTYLNTLEKNSVFGGCKACWDNPQNPGENSCWNNSMDGILTPDGRTRAIWWTYKYYADSLDKRLLVKSSSEQLISIAYFDGTGNLNLLLGNLNETKYSNVSLEIKNISNMATFRNKVFNVYEIPNVGSNYLEKPIFLFKNKFTQKNKGINVNFKNVNAKSIYHIVLSK